MDRLSIVTFISNNETVNILIFSLFESIRQRIPLTELLIYADNFIGDEKITGNGVKLIVNPHLTKYSRILKSLEDSNSMYILYVDNDIVPEINTLLDLVGSMQDNRIDLAWGTIGVLKMQGFVSKLIGVDKTLSHKIIRPLLWNMNIGISVPGQVFLINKKKFQKDLSHIDTVFDDLTVGICARQNHYVIKMIQAILGYEKPSLKFNQLIKQRIRWAQGFYETLINNIRRNAFLLVVIHGFSYHLLCFAVWTLLFIIFSHSSIIAVVIWLALCFKLADFKFSHILMSLAYTLVFPIVHLCWLSALLSNIIHGCCFNRSDGKDVGKINITRDVKKGERK